MTIQLNRQYFKGDKLVITAKNNSKKNVYVQPSKVIGGKKTTAGSIKFSDLAAGTTINLTMQKTPAKAR